jgi:hypothetical protein
LGYSITPVTGVLNLTANVNTTIASTGTLPSGTWLIIATCTVGGGVAGNTYIWIGDNSNAYASNKVIAESPLLGGQFFSATLSYVGTGTGPFLLAAQFSNTGANANGRLYCTRLA